MGNPESGKSRNKENPGVGKSGEKAHIFKHVKVSHFQYFNFSIFHRFGVAGRDEQKSYLCVLPMNMLNQKVYGFLFYWLGFLMVASMLMLTIRVFLTVSTTFREIYLKLVYNFSSIDVSNSDLRIAKWGFYS